MKIEQIAELIEEEIKPKKQFFSANDVRRAFHELSEGKIINALIMLKRQQKIIKWSNKNWRWIK
ncbi:MAG TPA: hypothetical protein ENI53_01340 [Thermoplasmatales archaeon]|nr:hypothetical protein [Thermoplasmatales archaeon]